MESVQTQESRRESGRTCPAVTGARPRALRCFVCVLFALKTKNTRLHQLCFHLHVMNFSKTLKCTLSLIVTNPLLLVFLPVIRNNAFTSIPLCRIHLCGWVDPRKPGSYVRCWGRARTTRIRRPTSLTRSLCAVLLVMNFKLTAFSLSPLPCPSHMSLPVTVVHVDAALC